MKSRHSVAAARLQHVKQHIIGGFERSIIACVIAVVCTASSFLSYIGAVSDTYTLRVSTSSGEAFLDELAGRSSLIGLCELPPTLSLQDDQDYNPIQWGEPCAKLAWELQTLKLPRPEAGRVDLRSADANTLAILGMAKANLPAVALVSPSFVQVGDMYGTGAQDSSDSRHSTRRGRGVQGVQVYRGQQTAQKMAFFMAQWMNKNVGKQPLGSASLNSAAEGRTTHEGSGVVSSLPVSCTVALHQNSFTAVVLDPARTVVVFFCAPWAKSCNKSRDVVRSVSDSLCGEAHIQVASVDVSQEGLLASQHRIVSLPSTVVYWKHLHDAQTTNKRPVLYTGDFKVDALVSFILNPKEPATTQSRKSQVEASIADSQSDVSPAVTNEGSSGAHRDNRTCDENSEGRAQNEEGNDTNLLNVVQQLSSGFCRLNATDQDKLSQRIEDAFKCSCERCRVVQQTMRRALDNVSELTTEKRNGGESRLHALESEIARLDRLVNSADVGARVKATLIFRRAVMERIQAQCYA